jgi:hypothetical protein
VQPQTSPSPVTAPPLIQRWGQHHTTREVTGYSRPEVPRIDEGSTLLEDTESLRLRKQLHGAVDRSTRFPDHPEVRLSAERLFPWVYFTVFPYCIQFASSSGALYASSTLGSGEGLRARHRRRSGSGASLTEGAHQATTPRRDGSSERNTSRGYFSESEAHSRLSARKAGKSRVSPLPYVATAVIINFRCVISAVMTTLSEEQFMQMQEQERYGYWHSRSAAVTTNTRPVQCSLCLAAAQVPSAEARVWIQQTLRPPPPAVPQVRRQKSGVVPHCTCC